MPITPLAGRWYAYHDEHEEENFILHECEGVVAHPCIVGAQEDQLRTWRFSSVTDKPVKSRHLNLSACSFDKKKESIICCECSEAAPEEVTTFASLSECEEFGEIESDQEELKRLRRHVEELQKQLREQQAITTIDAGTSWIPDNQSTTCPGVMQRWTYDLGNNNSKMKADTAYNT